MRRVASILFVLLFVVFVSPVSGEQHEDKPRPEEWNGLVLGGRFMDRFEPMPIMGKLTSDTWGADGVRPRYVDNGIEEAEWSYWGGNVRVGPDGKYNLYVCRWPENSPKGHMQWRDSDVVHAVSDNSYGPYKVVSEIGKGHNPEIYVTKDGRKVIYVIGGYYISDSFEGPWKRSKFVFDRRDRKVIEGLSNLTFAQRPDGSYLMICRGGGVWISEDGVKPYRQVSNQSVYPPVEGRFEDPVVWKTNVQYHMIVNDWYGRIAYYLRSKDGINWKVDSGEAYLPGIAKYEDGTVVDWYKYERIKVLQDKYGRAIQAMFAVIDWGKWEDKPNDIHSSKMICIPLTVGRQLAILNELPITVQTEAIRVRVRAEKGFDPHTDVDLNSLRFGAPEEVDFGRGSKVLKTEKDGHDLIITFAGEGNGITTDNFAGKLLGKTSSGKLLFGYARLPDVDYMEPALSTRLPKFQKNEGGTGITVEVQNFGQVKSESSRVTVALIGDDGTIELATAKVPSLASYETTMIAMNCERVFEKGKAYRFKIVVDGGDLKHEVLERRMTPSP